MVERFWRYAQTLRAEDKCVLEEDKPRNDRPPVFVQKATHLNVLMRPGASSKEIDDVLSQMPLRERHRWFGSMSSSQALALSVFGNLKYHRLLPLFNGFKCECGGDFVSEESLVRETMVLEHSVEHLGEPRATSIDVFFSGTPCVAVECKLTESEVGKCSRPRLREKAPTYQDGFCDSNYRPQMGRHERCPLTKLGVLYWQYIPQLFHWRSDEDHMPCPLYRNYQLVRNVLAVATGTEDIVTAQRGHAVLLYDARNPSFLPGGDGFIAFDEVQKGLKHVELIRKCSWQGLVQHLREAGLPPWLSDGLRCKYGL